jgi:integrase/recombinase XerD
LALAVVQDLREHRAPATAEELTDFETDVLAGFVLGRPSAGLTDSTIRNDTNRLELIRDWFGRPLWAMQPADADAYFGKVLRDARLSTRTGRAASLAVYFRFLELRHKVELHNLTGRVVECPLDEINRPRASVDAQLRIPPTVEEVEQLFAGWRGELATCRKFAPVARNYAVARLAADVGLRINEARMLDLDDVRWELGRFGKLNVRHGKGSRRKGPKARLVSLINGADRSLCWYIEDVLGLFDIDPAGRSVPLFPVRASPHRRHLHARHGRRVPSVAGRGRRAASAGVGGQGDTACAASLLRLAALPGRDEPVRDPGIARTRLDRHDGPVHQVSGIASDEREAAGRLLRVARQWFRSIGATRCLACMFC